MTFTPTKNQLAELSRSPPQEIQAMDEWISVETPPANSREVLVC